jgi:hypothetical protein
VLAALLICLPLTVIAAGCVTENNNSGNCNALGGNNSVNCTQPENSTTGTVAPITGDWNVTYGASATVTITLARGEYKEIAKTPVEVTGGLCDLPAGTVISTFMQTGQGTYAGRHGLWFPANCSFANWGEVTFSLSFDGKTLTANIEHGYELVTFTKI